LPEVNDPSINREIGLNCRELRAFPGTPWVMPDRFLPAKSGSYAADGTPESYLEMLLTHPELEGLEPFYIDWEFIWPM